MASAAQIEAFAWWLAQDREGRKASSVAGHFNVSESTAQKWLVQFNRKIEKVASETVSAHLAQFPDEYRQAQSRTMAILPALLDGLEANARILQEMAENGKLASPKLIKDTASALKTVYAISEAASGADVAKRRAAANRLPGGSSGERLGLPDLGAFFLADSVEVETVGDVIASGESGPCNESGNEFGAASAAMPEK